MPTLVVLVTPLTESERVDLTMTPWWSRVATESPQLRVRPVAAPRYLLAVRRRAGLGMADRAAGNEVSLSATNRTASVVSPLQAPVGWW
jgi:hypothetical protein